MVVVTCLIVMLYMVAEERLNELPAAAERASFQAVLAQLKAGVNLEMLASLSAGNFNRIAAMEGANPMDFLLETPGNYMGELDGRADHSTLRRSSWYYDRSAGELVYLVGDASVQDVQVVVGGTVVYPGELRLRITSASGNENNRSLQGGGGQGAAGGSWQGLLLVPVYPFEWQARPVLPVEA